MSKGKFIVNINGKNKKIRSALINKNTASNNVNMSKENSERKANSYIINDVVKEKDVDEKKEVKTRKAYEEEKFKFEKELLEQLDNEYKEKKVKEKQEKKDELELEDKIEIQTENVNEEEYIPRRTIRSAKDNKRIDEGIDILNNYKDKVDKNRQKRIGKTYNEIKEEIDKKRNERKKVYKSIKKSFVIIIILVLCILLFLLYEYGPVFGISLDKFDTDKEKKIDIVTTDSDIYTNYNDELLVYSNQKIATYNKNAKRTWEYNLDSMFNPSIYTYEKYLAIVNNTSGNIYLLESKKEILDIKIDGTINHVYMDEFGNMAVEYSTTGYKKVIGVYSKSGKNLYNAYLDNDSIIDLKLLENANRLLVFQTNSVSSKIGVRVNLIDGTKSEENLVQLAKFDNNYIYDLTIQGKNIIIVLDDRLVKLNIDNGNIEDVRKFESSQISFISLTSNYFTTIENKLNEESGNYLINMLRFDNSLISSTSIESVPRLMQNSGLLNYFVYQDSLSVINKWGIEIKNEKLDITPKSIIIFNNQKAIALVYVNKIRVIKI